MTEPSRKSPPPNLPHQGGGISRFGTPYFPPPMWGRARVGGSLRKRGGPMMPLEPYEIDAVKYVRRVAWKSPPPSLPHQGGGITFDASNPRPHRAGEAGSVDTPYSPPPSRGRDNARYAYSPPPSWGRARVGGPSEGSPMTTLPTYEFYTVKYAWRVARSSPPPSLPHQGGGTTFDASNPRPHRAGEAGSVDTPYSPPLSWGRTSGTPYSPPPSWGRVRVGGLRRSRP